ncbi:hypothetical protein QCD60_25930 [Pokkaliibacter sp. MBI-7]|uniref:hypothetical protein n=1 Tax=Pokkaliibacter sp. MBI-7 TaxID=3040600 RepID=UPI00244B47AB|nr:hypothetical protein [Pokkaliibacter sp. MBI-7]MDH2435975.1 hypothetical protein [Pokkaliibacter sp. MBI-7]
MKSWIDNTRPISKIDAEICYLLKDDFYYGPDSHPQIVERKEVDPLPTLDFPRVVEQMARTSEVSGHEHQLANYYSGVLSAAKRHEKSFNEIHQYFWLRFWLWNSEEDIHVGFPWYDTLGEIENFIKSVIETESGEVFYDVDQGWELDVYARDGFLYIQERDPDYDEVYYSVSVPRDPLIKSLIELIERAGTQIESLSNLVGHNYWRPREPVDMPAKEASGVSKKLWWKLW